MLREQHSLENVSRNKIRGPLGRLTAMLLAGTCLTPCAALAVDVMNEAQLRAAIFAANGGGDSTINITQNITLTQSLPMITASATIAGNGNTIDADNKGRAIFVQAGTVQVSNLTINNAVANGGDGGNGSGTSSAGGGGGLGAGAAVFVNSGASASLTNVTVGDASAKGGAGGGHTVGPGLGGGGGGGLGGAGGSGGSLAGGGGGGYAGLGGLAGSSSGGGGGGEFGAGGSGTGGGGGGGGGQQGAGGNGGNASPQTGGGGGGGANVNDDGQNGSGTTGGAGGVQGGNGGNARQPGSPGAPLGGGGGGGTFAAGGAGNVSGGGGGGGGSGDSSAGGAGGTGGGGGGGGAGSNGAAGGDFGGGGGSGRSPDLIGGRGGFGGGGGSGNAADNSAGGMGGFGAGGGGGFTGGTSDGGLGGKGGSSDGSFAAGGGGAALGGAFFARDGGSLTVNGGSLTGTYSVTGGTTTGEGGATAGQAQGRVMYLQGSGTTTLDVSSGTRTIAGNDAIAGSGTLGKSGAGTLALTGNNTNFTGGVAVTGGLVSFASATSLGSGAITLDGGGLQWATGNTTDISSRLAPLGAGGGTVDTNGNNMTFETSVSGTGGLTKAGEGSLALNGNNTYAGGTTVNAGTLRLATGASLASTGALTVNGGTFGLNNNSQTVGTLSGTGGAITLGSGTLTTNSSVDSSLAAAITGTGGFVKGGSGTLTLTGSNTYSGTTTITNGSLQIGDGGTAGTLGAGAVTNNGTLKFNRSDQLVVANRITGTGSVEKLGAGTTILTSTNNSYTGTTTITSGTLQVGSTTVAGKLGSGAVINNATLAFRLPSGDQAVSNAISGTGNLTVDGGAQRTLTLTGTNTYSGTTTIAASTSLRIGNGGTTGTLGSAAVINNGQLSFNRSDELTVSNDISGNGGVNKDGDSLTIFTGTNSYSGNTTIRTGTLQIGDGNTSGTLGTGNVVINGGTLQFNRSDQVTVSGTIFGVGSVSQAGAGTIVLTGANTYSGGTAVSGGGTLSVSADNNLGAAGGGIAFNGSGTLQTTSAFSTDRAIAITGTGTLETAASTTLTVNGVVSGTGALAKSGGGTAVLTAANTYAGGTQINAGTLSISAADQLGAAGTGITFNGSGTLQATSTLAIDRTVGITGTGALEAAANTILTVNGAVSGSGTLVKSGDGTVVLTATNAIRSGMQINAGTLSISASNQTGDSRGEISFGGGTLRSTGGTVAVNQTINLASANGNFDVTGNVVLVNGQVSGANGVVKSGEGTLALTADNSYSGGTTIAAGEVRVGNDGTTGTLGTGNVVNDGRLRIRRADSYTVSNTISGTGEVIQNGTGTTILTGNNTYAGGTTIVFGTLQVGDGNTAGTLGTGSVGVLNTSTLVFNRSDALVVSGDIRGTGALKQIGSGTTVLTGNSTHSGATTISAGTLQIGDGGTSGNLGSGAVTNDGMLAFNRSDTLAVSAVIGGSGGLTQIGSGTTILTGNNTYTGPTTISAGILSVGSGAGGGRLGTGNVALGVGGKLQFNRFNEITVANQISGDGGIIQAGSGTTILTGNNTFTGGTTVSAGTLQGTTSSLQGDILNNATVRFDQGTNGTYAGVMSGTGRLTKSGTGTLILSGANSYSGGTTISGGSLQVGNGGTTGSITGNVANNGTLAFNRSDDITFGGTISGSGALDKLGAGTLIFTADNTYSGLTTIAAGTLQLGNGGTTGMIAGNVLNNGILAFNRSDDIVFGGNVDGSGAISYMGPGKVTLTGTISNTGGTVLAGTVLAGSDASLGAAGATLTFAGGTLQATDSFTVGRPVSLITGGGIFDTAGNTLTVSGNVSGAGGLTKTGDGTLILGGTNSYSGGTTVLGGTLQGTTASLMGNILNNANVAFTQATNGTYAGVLSGSGNVSIGGSGAVTFTGANSYTGTTTIASGSKLNLNGGTLGTGAVSNSGELHFNQGATVSAIIGGSGAVFLEEDSGTTILTGNNSYTGTTRVWSGSTLQVGTGGTSGTLGTGRVQITDGTLRFDRSDALVVAGEISGNGNVVQAGSGTTALTFDSTYGGTTTIEDGTLKLGNGGTTGSLGSGSIVNNATLAFDRSNNLFVANAISGSGNVVQAGTGATYLTGNNTYSGTTTITAGTLNVGNAGSSGTLGTGNVINDGTLRLFRGDSIEIANQISGAGNLVKAGAGIATLTGANSYSGTTSILSGILRVGNGGTLGSGEVITEARLEFSRADALTVANVISGEGLVAQTGAGTTTFTGNNSYGTTLIAAGTLSVGDGGTTGTLGTGEVINDAALLFNRSNALTVVGDISGTGSVTQMGSGTTSLTGTSTYGGGTTISGGTLQLGSGGTTGSIAGDVVNDGTLAFNRADAMTFAGVISGSGAVAQVGPGTTVLTGANTYTGGTTVSAGTLQGTTTSLQGNILNNGTVAFNQSTAGAYAGNISGTGGLLINGTGTVTLSGVNTYTGGTTVAGGTLQGTTTSLQGNILNNAAVTFSQAANGTYAGNMSGTGSLTFTGGGQYTLTGTNSYTGGTSVLAGALIGNSASLQGNILNNTSVTFNQTGTGTYAGAMSGSGTMTLQGGGTLTMTGSNTYTGATTVDASTLIVNGSLASTVAVTNGGILAGNGSTGGFVSTGGIIAPGNSIGTLNINGNFTQNGGTYIVEVNAQGQNDKVNVNGAATINGASVQVMATPGNYATSTTYTILNATGGISGTYTGVSSNYAFLTPSLAYDANNVFLTLALQGSTPFSGFGGNTVNQRNVGSALDQSYAGATGDFATVIGALANLSTGQAGPTLNTISGQPYADFGTFNVANNALFMNALGQQMALARGGSGNGQRQALAQACDIDACDGASPFSVWGSALGGLGSVQGDGNSSTFTYNVGGTAAGIDYRVSPSFLVGLGAGFTSGTQWVDSFQGKGWASTVSVAAYASFTQGNLYLDALAGYAWSNNQLQRQIAIPGLQPRTANGSTGANQFLGQVEAGYKLGLHAPMQASVTPFARFQASSINQAAFTEWGANSLNLNVAQQTTSSVRTMLGAELAGAVNLGNTRTAALGLRLGWLHEYANTTRPMTAAFAGAPTANFTVYGATPQRDSAVVGFQAGTEVAAGTQLYLRYDGEVGATANNHALNIGLRLSW